MSLTVTKPEDTGGDFKLLEAGTHAAVCTQMIDIGPQEVEWQGQVSEKNKVRLRWEVPAERVEWEDKDGNKHEGPMTIGKEYTASLHEKAVLRQHLEAWRGKTFTEAELMGFDLTNVLGAPCMLSVIHKTAQNGKTYAMVDGVSKIMKGMKVEPEGELLAFDFDNHTEEELNSLTKWVREKVMEGKAIVERQKSRSEPVAAPVADDLGDDIPF